MYTSNLDSIRKDGALPHHAECYDIRYLRDNDDVVCAKCANVWAPEDWEGDEPTTAFIDWEGSGHHCAECNEFLPSEYGEPDEN